MNLPAHSRLIPLTNVELSTKDDDFGEVASRLHTFRRQKTRSVKSLCKA